jgi:transcriptional regulator with XRE-family HTH domain
MRLPSTFARRLYLARLNAGFDQKELGEAVGLTGHTIGRLERGQTTQISIRALRRLARVLKVTTDWLLAMDVPGDATDETQEEELLAAPHV